MQTVPGPSAAPSPGPAAPPEVTVIADRYEMGPLLGRGGMAEVFAGTDRRLGRQVAVKLLRPEMAIRDDIRSRFEAEARAAAQLSHPNVVAVFDTGEHEGTAYIVMERLPGETLADRLAQGREPGRADPEWLRRVGLEVLDALGAAHAAGIIHRDVKPGNILIAADGRAKVADFGIAKSVQEDGGADLTGTGQLLGTPAYLAPERLDGAPASPQADLYALGVVLYEALAGTKPFDGDSPLAVARAAVSGQHRPLGSVRPDLDPALVDAVERAMATDPARRFASAADMAAALSTAGSPGAGIGVGSTTVVDAPVDHTMVLPPRPARRNRPWAWVLLAGLAVVAVVLLARAGGDGGTPVATSASTPTTAAQSSRTSAPTTAAAAPASGGLAQQLRDEASRLSATDGRLAPILGQRLLQLADQVDSGSAGGEATALLASVMGWNRAGLISGSAATAVVGLLQQVPGVNLSVISGAGSQTTPATAAPATARHGKGKGKGGGD